MGLKSGSRDAGLDEEEADETDTPAPEETVKEPENDDVEVSDGTGDPPGASVGTDDRPSMESIPYKLRRSKVNEGREQVPFFLRDEVMDGEADLQDSLEAMLDEQVYKSDYREAAMIVAQREPQLVAEVLREWGYDLD